MITISYFCGLFITGACIGTMYTLVYGMLTIGIGFMAYAVFSAIANMFLNRRKRNEVQSTEAG